MEDNVNDKLKMISEDEAKVYDRQIRLWGLDAQKRLRAAKVLIIGMGGLGAEVAKNIILAGIKSIHMMDNQDVTEKDFKSQFFLSKDDLGKNRAIQSVKKAQRLNPMVEVTAEKDELINKPISFFCQYDVIILLDSDWSTAIKLDRSWNRVNKNDINNKDNNNDDNNKNTNDDDDNNNNNNNKNNKLFIGSCFGLYGYMMAQLNQHEYAEEVLVKSDVGKTICIDDKNKNNDNDNDNGEPEVKKKKIEEEKETKTIKKTINFSPFKEVFENIKYQKSPLGFLLCKVMDEFIKENKNLPGKEDKEKLITLREKINKQYNLNDQHIPIDYFEECYDQLSSVCAVVGGVLAQEVIKVVSKKDCPHDNYFFFHGCQGVGLVDHI